MKKFTLEINMGNEAMKDELDIENALVKVSKLIHECSDISRPIFDTNGNRVGKWWFE